MDAGSFVDLGNVVAACVAGDSDAMQQIYEHCSSRVYALMVRIVGRQDADDLTQQVFLQMFRKLDQQIRQERPWHYHYLISENIL